MNHICMRLSEHDPSSHYDIRPFCRIGTRLDGELDLFVWRAEACSFVLTHTRRRMALQLASHSFSCLFSIFYANYSSLPNSKNTYSTWYLPYLCELLFWTTGFLFVKNYKFFTFFHLFFWCAHVLGPSFSTRAAKLVQLLVVLAVSHGTRAVQ